MDGHGQSLLGVDSKYRTEEREAVLWNMERSSSNVAELGAD